MEDLQRELNKIISRSQYDATEIVCWMLLDHVKARGGGINEHDICEMHSASENYLYDILSRMEEENRVKCERQDCSHVVITTSSSFYGIKNGVKCVNCGARWDQAE